MELKQLIEDQEMKPSRNAILSQVVHTHNI